MQKRKFEISCTNHYGSVKINDQKKIRNSEKLNNAGGVMSSKDMVSLEFIHDFIKKTADAEIEKMPKTAAIMKAKEDMRRLAMRKSPNQNFTFTAGEMNAYLG